MENHNSNKKILITAIIIVAIVGLFFGLRYFAQNEKDKIVYPVENEIKNDLPEEENEITKPEDETAENEDEKAIESFVQCLAEAGMVIYGSKTCPACASLVNSFGGYEIVKPIYVECSQEWDRCSKEMKTNYVPEIQIKGEVYQGPRDFNSFGAAAGCSI